jgi:hypothetical protein
MLRQCSFSIECVVADGAVELVSAEALDFHRAVAPF